MTKKAEIGDHIKFKREGKHMEGNVIDVREASVIVDMGENAKGEPIKTVVNHKNYQISSK